MNIWLISAFEPTPVDKVRPMRFMGIADAAIQAGHNVVFFTTTFNHFSKSQRYESNSYHTVLPEQYEVVYIHSKPYQKNISAERMMAHLDLAKKLLQEIEQRKDKPNAILISLPPLSTVQKITEWGKRHSVPVIVDIIDPWPDVFIKAFPSSVKGLAKAALSPFYGKVKKIMRDCAGVTAISNDYIKWAQQYFKIDKPAGCFYPAVPYEEIKQAFKNLSITHKKDESILRIIYAGSLASSYDIPTILNAAEILEKQYPGKTKFVIAGKGPQEELVKERQKQLPNVQYLGWLDHEGMYRELYLSDIGLTQHVPGATQSVTYKLFDYLAAGLPIMNSLHSEMADIIVNDKVGFNNKSGDAAGLAKNIAGFIDNKELLQQYRSNAFALTAQLGDAKVVYGRMIDFIAQVVNKAIA